MFTATAEDWQSAMLYQAYSTTDLEKIVSDHGSDSDQGEEEPIEKRVEKLQKALPVFFEAYKEAHLVKSVFEKKVFLLVSSI